MCIRDRYSTTRTELAISLLFTRVVLTYAFILIPAVIEYNNSLITTKKDYTKIH